jgi:hypothetical protein
LRTNSLVKNGDRKGVDYPRCVKYKQHHPRIIQFHQSNALCAEGKDIGGKTNNIYGKGVITMVEEVIIRKSAITGMLGRYKTIGSRVKAINSQSL